MRGRKLCYLCYSKLCYVIYICGSNLCYLCGSKLCYIMLCVVANYVMCVISNYVGVFDNIEFATTHVAFLVNICVATKNATCVFAIDGGHI
jgi:hypothetical protein